jgi:hypothetical protein
MKHEIIYTDDYALIVSDEQIEDVRPHKGKFHLEKGLIINQFPTYLTDLTECKLIIAHRPLTDAPILEGVALLPEFEDDDFLNTEIQVVGDNKTMSVSNFLKKYGKETYKYTEDDLVKAFKAGHSGAFVKEHTVPHYKEYIQFLQPKRPKYFECIIDNILSYNADDGINALVNPNFGELKTIINSQGQTELIGEYIF